MSRALGAFVAYAAIFAVLGRVWLGFAATSLPGGDTFSFADDARLHTWVIGWIAHALAHEPGRLLDAPIHAPLRAQLAGTEHMASTQLLAVPVTWMTGNPVFAMNAAIFASYLVSALAMRALLLAYGCGMGVAFVGGLVAALGPFRVPANVQSLQYVVGHLALVAWALRRLRDEPSGRRTALLAVATAAGVLSSYYTMPMLAVVAAVAVAAELARAQPGRASFVARALGAAGIAAIPLAVLSLPYLRVSASGTQVGGLETIPAGALWELAAALGPLVFGWATPALAVAGLALGWWGGRGGRAAAAVGAATIVVGLVLYMQPWPLPALIAASPLRYLRAQTRFLVIVGFGASLLAAAGLEAVTRGRTVATRAAVLTLVALLVVATRGWGLSGVRDLVRPVSTDRGVYEAVRSAVGGSRRPLLELPLVDARAVERGSLLPLGQIETDAMLGGLVHGLPLVTGHSAYPPAHRPLLATLLRRLPQSTDELVDLTDAGWVLLRPADYWKNPAQRETIVRSPALTRVVDREGWTLLRVPHPTRHPEWVAALAAGPRAGRTLLDTPLAPVTAPVARLGVGGGPMPIATTPGQLVVVNVLVTNAGATPWPVLAPPGADDPPVVRLVARWTTEGKGEARSEEVAIHRDVFPGETLAVPYLSTAPGEVGTYDVVIDVAQNGGSASFGRDASARVRVEVRAPDPLVVACLGDSNTAAGWPTPENVGWCEYAARECAVADGRPTRFVNLGIGGAVASAPFGPFELERALAAGADRLVLAFGTNDVVEQSKPPATLVADLQALCAGAAPRPCWVATVPPTLLGTDPEPWNAAIRAAFGETGRVIDFTTDVVAIAGDGKHLDDASKRLVAGRVRTALGCDSR